jgi:anaerobic nitric oxide reductase flavorubredoxin
VLIDTVDHKFSREFVQNLAAEIDLAAIDYVVINHAERSRRRPDRADGPYPRHLCTHNAIDSITGHHHHPEWNFHPVKTGDSLDIGNGKQLVFIETPCCTGPTA